MDEFWTSNQFRNRWLRNFFILILLPTIVLSFISCTGDYKLPKHDGEILEKMMRFRSSVPGHALYISDSGLLLSVPICSDSFSTPYLPLDGVYYDSLRTMADWRWSAGSQTEEQSSSAGTYVYPDRLERTWNELGTETVFLDPTHAVILIFFESTAERDLRFYPRFDLRAPNQVRVNHDYEYDANEHVLHYGDPASAFVSVYATGEFIDSPREERFEYYSDYQMLDGVATNEITGFFTFPHDKKAFVIIAVSPSIDDNLHLIQGVQKSPEVLINKATKRVLDFLDMSPVLCNDDKLEAAAAWDRWLLRSHISNRSTRYHPWAAPPLFPGINPDSFSRLLPAWFMASGDDSTLISLFAEGFQEQVSDPDADPVQTLQYLQGLVDYVKLTGRLDILEELNKTLSDGFQVLFSAQDDDNIFLPTGLSPAWEELLHSADLPVPAISSAPEFTFQANQVAGRLLHLGPSNSSWKTMIRDDLTDLASCKVARLLPVNSTLNCDMFLWKNKQREAWKNALENPGFNLQFVETLLRSERKVGSYAYLVPLANRIWRNSEGYAFNLDTFNYGIGFTTPFWVLTGDAVHSGLRLSLKSALKSYLLPRYGSWYSNIWEHASEYPGRTPEDLAVISERLSFFYKSLLGVHLFPAKNLVRLSPPGTSSFWENREITFTISMNREQLAIMMNPSEGVYHVTRPGGESSLYLDVEDLPIDGTSLQARIAVKRKGISELKRVIDPKSGEWTFYLDDHKLETTIRKKNE